MEALEQLRRNIRKLIKLEIREYEERGDFERAGKLRELLRELEVD